MAEDNVTKPSQLDESIQLLDRAVHRLEAAREALARKGPQQQEAESDHLKALQEENRTLQEMNDTVSKRLDGVIDRLKTVLEV